MKNFSGIIEGLDITTKKYVDDGLAKKANLNGGNIFYNSQTFAGVDSDIGHSIIDTYFDAGDNQSTIFGVQHNGDADDSGKVLIGSNDGNNVELLLGNNAGTSGQVLTSQGAGKTPIWADVVKHGYTQLTNEDLNTITEVGWYRAGANNTCTHKPSGVSTFPFVLMVEKSTDQNIKQTLYPILNSAISLYESHIRYYTSSSWSTWSKQQTMGDGQTQTFSGRKTFGSGINLTSSLQVGGSAGTAGQVLTSTGAGTPQWQTPSGGGASPTDVQITGGNGYVLMPQGDSGKYTFIGYFDLGDTNQSFTMTIKNQGFSITLNEHDGADTTVYIELDRHSGSNAYTSSARLSVYIPGAEPAINTVNSIAATDDITLSFSLNSSYSLNGTEIRMV